MNSKRIPDLLFLADNAFLVHYKTISVSGFAECIERFTEQLGLARYSLYLQDYGGPVGFRLAAAHLERVTRTV